MKELIVSLTCFLQMPDVMARVKPLRPKVSRKIGAPLRVEPRSNRYTMVGTAFDYLVRFELQRRAPYAVARKWMAESACDMLWKQTDDGAVVWWDELHAACHLPPEEAGRRAHAVVENAKSALGAYLKTKAPKRTELANLAAHAIRLAKLDPVARAFRPLDPDFEAADPEVVEDLLAMLAIVPFDSLLHSKVVLLNPDFKEPSELVGGADADLIAGDLLVDFKVTKKGEVAARDLDQLLGYYLLARHQRRLDREFPEINRAAFYFCRHGHLWVLDVSTWVAHPEFAQIENWFFRAKGVFEKPSRIAEKTGRRY
jgi:hypothetical protein